MLISDLLSCVDSKTSKLAAVVHEKTGGNAFYVRQFLLSLKDRHLLTFRVGTAGWIYDVERIKMEMAVSENVKDFMVGVLHDQLSIQAQNTLQIASFLGSAFDEELIEPVASKLNSDEEIEAAPGTLRGPVSRPCCALWGSDGPGRNASNRASFFCGRCVFGSFVAGRLLWRVRVSLEHGRECKKHDRSQYRALRSLEVGNV